MLEVPSRAAAAEALADIHSAHTPVSVIARLARLAPGAFAKAVLNLDTLIDEVRLLQPDLALKHITIRRESPPGLPLVSGDPIQLQQVFLNLITNASEAIVRGDQIERRITGTSSHPAHGHVEVAVADTGVGATMDPEQMFESFVTTKLGGLGMGLAISRRSSRRRGSIYRATGESE